MNILPLGERAEPPRVILQNDHKSTIEMKTALFHTENGRKTTPRGAHPFTYQVQHTLALDGRRDGRAGAAEGRERAQRRCCPVRAAASPRTSSQRALSCRRGDITSLPVSRYFVGM